MSDTTTDQIERDVERKRANVEATLDRLKQRTSLDNVMRDIADHLPMEEARRMLRSVGEHARQNPVALGLVAAGIGWMVFGGATSRHTTVQRTRRRHSDDDDNTGMHPSDPRSSTRRQGLAADVTDRVGEAVDSMRDLVGDATDAISRGTGGMMDQTRHMTDNATRQLRAHPVVTASALALVGAVIGAAMPRSTAEEDLFRAPHDTLMRQGRRKASDMAHRASAAARRTVQATREAATEEGLWPTDDGRSLGEKLGTIAETAIDEARSGLGEVVSGEAATTKRHTSSQDPSRPS
jgi:hypothetical protein